tara:strand:+ start:161 stop:385 length:225 start_codon:yes stop_codon:yes gene_type:complete
MDINDTTVKRIIKRLFNTVIDEETKLRRVLSMETNNEHPEALFSGLYLKAEQHLEQIVKAQNKIVLLQNLINPE